MNMYKSNDEGRRAFNKHNKYVHSEMDAKQSLW